MSDGRTHHAECWRDHRECAATEITRLRERVRELEADGEALEDALRDLMVWGVDLDDPRLSYVVVQVDRADIEAATSLLAARYARGKA